MTWLYVLIALAAGAALAWFYLRAQLGERLRARETDVSRLSAALAAAESSVSRLQAQSSELQAQLAAERAASLEKLAAAELRLSEREALAARYLADAEKMKAALQTEFQAVASKLLEEKSAKFTDHNKTQVEALLHPLRQQLSDFRQRVDTVYKTDSDDRAALKAQIEQLRLLNTTITAEAHALTTALKGQSQARGAWGELVLDRLLESAGLIKSENYSAQESLTANDGRRLRPDIILRLPDERCIVIDSKVSLIAYERAVNTSDEAVRAAATKEHAAAVRLHVDQLSSKKYEDTGKLITPEYVMMFVPIDSAYALALQADPSLFEWAFERRVILCTAPALLSTLKTIATLWKQDRQTKNVQAIADRGGALYDKFAGLIDDLESLGLQLGRTRESYEAAMNKLKTGKGNLLAQVEDLKKLGAKAKKSLPASSDET